MKYEQEILSFYYFKKFKRLDKIINVQPVAVWSIYTLYIYFIFIFIWTSFHDQYFNFSLQFRILSIAFAFSYKFSTREEIGYLLTILNKNKKFR